jgi:hypothetical protein
MDTCARGEGAIETKLARLLLFIVRLSHSATSSVTVLILVSAHRKKRRPGLFLNASLCTVIRNNEVKNYAMHHD